MKIEDIRNGKSGGSAHARWWQTSDAIWGAGLALGILLETVAPLSFSPPASRFLLSGAGAVLILAGLVFIVNARIHLARAQQPAGPGLPTTRLLTNGVYSLSRNPVYLGIVLAFAGLGISANLPWLLVLLPALAIATHVLLLMPEERYLLAVFGKEYERYAESTRRWL